MAGAPLSLVEATDLVSGAFVAAQIHPTLISSSATEGVMHVNGLRLTLSLSAKPLDLRPFDGASSPDVAFGLSAQKQRGLVAHRSAMMLRLAPGKEDAHPLTSLALGMIAARALTPAVRPALIHWAHTNEVFSLDEFEGAVLLQDPQSALSSGAHHCATRSDRTARNGARSRATLLLVERARAALLTRLSLAETALRGAFRESGYK